MATLYHDPARNQTAWKYWNTTATTTVNWSDEVWGQWVSRTTSAMQTITAMTADQNQLWQYWNESGWYQPALGTEAETADERQARRERESRLRLRAEQERAAGIEQRARANDRAMELLEMLLTPEERQYRAEHEDRILVRSQRSGRMFVIRMSGVHGNITEIDEHGCNLGTVCVAPLMHDADTKRPLPTADGWVGQLLMARYEEEEFDRVGNWSRRASCQQPNIPILRRVHDTLAA